MKTQTLSERLRAIHVSVWLFGIVQLIADIAVIFMLTPSPAAYADSASDFLDALRAHGKPVVGATLGGGYQLCSMIRGGADPAQLGGAWAFYAPEAQQYLCPDTLH